MSATDPLRAALQNWLETNREKEHARIKLVTFDGIVMKDRYFTTDEVAALLAEHPTPTTHTEYAVKDQSSIFWGHGTDALRVGDDAERYNGMLFTREVTDWAPVKNLSPSPKHVKKWAETLHKEET